MKRFFVTMLAASLMLVSTSALAQVSVSAGYLGTFQRLSATKLDLSKSVYMNGLYAGFDNTIQFDQNMGISVGVYYVYSAAPATQLYQANTKQIQFLHQFFLYILLNNTPTQMKNKELSCCAKEVLQGEILT